MAGGFSGPGGYCSPLPVAMKLLSKSGEMPSLNPPDDESIKTLYVGGLDARVSEQDLRDNFYVHGEIESIRMVLQRACAFVTYTTREAAERAAEELSNKLVIKGVRLKLMWGRPQAPKPEGEMQDDDDTRQGAVFHAGMLPRSVISEQQSNQQPLLPGTENHTQLPLNYFNIPAPPQAARAFYPSMDPQRMGAVIPSQEGGDNKSGSEKQPEQQLPNHQGHNYPMAPSHTQGQFPPYYPPYGYMVPPPPYQQQQYAPYPPMAVSHPPAPPPPSSGNQYPQGPSKLILAGMRCSIKFVLS